MAFLGRESAAEKAKAEAYSRWLQSQNVMAIVSLVLGIFSLIEFGALVIFGVGGIITGAMAIVQLRRAGSNDSRTRGHALAWIGIITSVLSLIIATILYTRSSR